MWFQQRSADLFLSSSVAVKADVVEDVAEVAVVGGIDGVDAEAVIPVARSNSRSFVPSTVRSRSSRARRVVITAE